MSRRVKKSMKVRVLEFFQDQPEGATADEAVAFFGSKNYSTVTARITEMVNSLAPKLFKTGRTRRTRRGGYAAVLTATRPFAF